MAKNYTQAYIHMGTGNHTVNNSTNGHISSSVRLSDGTIVVAAYQNTSSDIQFFYSDDDGDSFTLCSTTMAGTYSGNGGVAMSVCEDDSLWVVAHDASSYPWLGTFTFNGTDVVAGLAPTDIKTAAVAHKSCWVLPFPDPDDGTKYRAVYCGGDTTSGKQWWRDLTVNGDWTGFSDNGQISIAAAAASYYTPNLAIPKWDTRPQLASGANPEILVTYWDINQPKFKKLTYTAGSPGSWGVGSAYTIGSGTTATQGVSGYYDPDEAVWVFATATSTAVFGFYTAGAANATAIHSALSGGPSTNDTPYCWYDREGYYNIAYYDASYESLKVQSGLKTSGYGSVSLTGTWSISTPSIMNNEGSDNPPPPETGNWSYLPELIPQFIDSGDNNFALDFVYFTSDAGKCFNFWREDGYWGNGGRGTPEIRAIATAHGTASTHPITVTKPSGTAEGDLLIAFFHLADYPSITHDSYTLPDANWLSIGQFTTTWNAWQSGYAGEFRAFYRIATASEPASYDFDWTGSYTTAVSTTVTVVAVNPGVGAVFHPRWPITGGSYMLFDTAYTTTHEIPHTSVNRGGGLQIASVATHDVGDKSPWSTPSGSPAWTEHTEYAHGNLSYRALPEGTTRTYDGNDTLTSNVAAEITSYLLQVTSWLEAGGAGGTGWGIAL